MRDTWFASSRQFYAPEDGESAAALSKRFQQYLDAEHTWSASSSQFNAPEDGESSAASLRRLISIICPMY